MDRLTPEEAAEIEAFLAERGATKLPTVVDHLRMVPMRNGRGAAASRFSAGRRALNDAARVPDPDVDPAEPSEAT